MSEREFQGWHKQEGLLWAETGGLRLVVHLPLTTELVRFAVIVPGEETGRPDLLVGSGTHDDIGHAQAAAEKMAARLEAVRREKFSARRRSGDLVRESRA